MEKVTIKNICNRRVGLTIPDLRINRSIMPGRTISLDKDTFEDALTYPGVTEMFTRKYLIVTEVDEAIEMGLVDEEKVVTDSSGKKMIEGTEDYEQIKTIIENGSDFQLKKLLSNEDAPRQDVIVAAASQSKNITLNKIQIIKDVTGVDLQKIIRVDD